MNSSQQSGRLLNECRWSSSRESVFNECKKKYWYTYYGSWEGWPKNSFDSRAEIEPLAEYLYMLKNIQPACMFIGSAVHKTIEWFLKTYKSKKIQPTSSQALSHVLDLCKKGAEESRQKLWRRHPKYHANIFEHYYNQPMDISSLEEKAKICTANWLSSPCIQNVVLSQKAEWKGIESVQTFSLEKGIEGIVVFDFFMTWKSASASTMIIFDWKTGQESPKIEAQLFAYAIAANICFSVPFDTLILTPFYLSQGPNGYKKYGTNQENPLDIKKIEEIKSKIISSATSMLDLHPKKNEEGSSPSPCLFPYTNDRRACRKCSFQQLCQEANYQDMEKSELSELVTKAIFGEHLK